MRLFLSREQGKYGEIPSQQSLRLQSDSLPFNSVIYYCVSWAKGEIKVSAIVSDAPFSGASLFFIKEIENI